MHCGRRALTLGGCGSDAMSWCITSEVEHEPCIHPLDRRSEIRMVAARAECGASAARAADLRNPPLVVARTSNRSYNGGAFGQHSESMGTPIPSGSQRSAGFAIAGR